MPDIFQGDMEEQELHEELSPKPDPDEPQSFHLTADVYKGDDRQAGGSVVRLVWVGAESNMVDVYRDGEKIATTQNGGTYLDDVGQDAGDEVSYRVCETNRDRCSNVATASFEA